MAGSSETEEGRGAAIALLRQLRRQGMETGVRNSGIAFDIGLVLYENALADPAQGMSVDMITDATGYSGPTVRLVLKRLGEAGSIAPVQRIGKTQLYALTARGFSGFDGYVAAVLAFGRGG
jgi:DNA-binding transcriptional ArsR family regulator